MWIKRTGSHVNANIMNLYLHSRPVLDRECMGFMTIIWEVIWLQKDKAGKGD